MEEERRKDQKGEEKEKIFQIENGRRIKHHIKTKQAWASKSEMIREGSFTRE